MTKEEVTVQCGEPMERDIDGRCRVPAADVYETPEAYVLMLDLPGVEKDAIALKLDKGELHVQASTFTRSFAIGNGIDTNTIDAHFGNGVLTVTVPKAEEAKAREIEVKVK